MKKRRKKVSNADIQDYILASLPLLYVFVFSYLPMVGIIIAFKKYRYDQGIFGSDWVGLDNFKFFFSSDSFVRIIRNTLGLNFIFIVSSIIAAVILAIILYGVVSKVQVKIYQTVFITPHFLSWVVVGYMVYGILSTKYGLLNQFLEAVGIGKVDLYSKPSAWPLILSLANVWKKVGMDLYVLN